MTSDKDLHSGYWVRSVADLGVDFIKTYTFWAGVGCTVLVIALVQSVETEAGKQEAAVTVFGLTMLGALFFLISAFSVYRRKNAMVYNLQAKAVPPLEVEIDPLEGATYQFELLTGDSYKKLVERAEDLGSLRRKLRLTKEKDPGSSRDEIEAKEDLLEVYEKKLALVRRDLSRLADAYHVPNVQLDLRVRIKNPDAYRVAKVKRVDVAFGTKPSFWTLEQEGLFDANGNELDLPLTLGPGEAVLGTYRCQLRKAGTLTTEKMASYLDERTDMSVPVQVSALCDDTFGDVSICTLEHNISLGPLKDTFTEHWRASKFYEA